MLIPYLTVSARDERPQQRDLRDKIRKAKSGQQDRPRKLADDDLTDLTAPGRSPR